MKCLCLNSRRKSGVVLALVAVLLPVLLGMVGLVVDAGLLMSVHRQSRNAADAAAMAAARELLVGGSKSAATTAANAFVKQHNGLADSQVTVNIPPESGPHAGNPSFVEVRVSQSSPTFFIHVLGGNRMRTVAGRSVAGFEPVRSPARIITLNPNAIPGLDIGGGGSLLVDGAVVVNSEGGGVDQFGDPIGYGMSGFSAAVSNNSQFRAGSVRTVGGVNNPENFKHYDTTLTGTPLQARSLPSGDPFLHLPPPTIATGVDPVDRGSVNISGNASMTLQPGVYSSIKVNSGNVVFEPGIYVVRGGELSVTEQNVKADGVMFYMTGSDYDVITGHPDIHDGAGPPPSTLNQNNFKSVTINAGLKFTGIDNPNSPYHGMLFYQRRWNMKNFNVQGNSESGNLRGTIYAKWAPMKIAGQGIYNAQFVVGEITTSGQGNVTILDGGNLIGRASQVFLVE
jgi:hypothetical protein